MHHPEPPQGAQSALRAIRLLKLFTPERPDMTLAELSAAAGLNKTTTHRLLQALQSEALVERNAATSVYSLGPGLMALGVQALSSSDLRRRVRPVLRMLARETGETATLEVPVEDSMLILDEVVGSHVVAASGNVGTRWPLHATSTGKAWLAFDESSLDRLSPELVSLTARTQIDRSQLQPEFIKIRRCGYAVTVDELEEGYSAVATVIRGALGDVQGALSIGGPTQRLGAPQRARLGSLLRQAASRLSQQF